ncbi:MAG: acetyl-CoA carboxylase carboxyltransferase subunit alpha [Gammaproteobacteria bacterium]|nr:acetyl-CoA carboxylase carboxyltransferase subunit alpha [Gammaproteobacteria bacterium]
MNLDFLDFEQPIAELKEKIEQLRHVGTDSKININKEIARLEAKSQELTKSIFNDLTDWQVVQLARHPLRPHTLDYIHKIFTEFDELHGDRVFKDDAAIVGGTARLNNRPVMVIGQQKGRSTKEKIKRNFGMASPEGYRKAQRLMKLAEKFNMPIITFIDTAGAYPGVGAEERGQSEAIATSLAIMSRLNVPIISTVIGEGGSGGALALGVCDKLLMLQYSIYSVISPEGCASILWKKADKAATAAAAMHLTVTKLFKLGLVDQIITEPLGGAHRNVHKTAQDLKQVIEQQLDFISQYPGNQLVDLRYQRLMRFGRFEN